VHKYIADAPTSSADDPRDYQLCVGRYRNRSRFPSIVWLKS